MKESKEWYVKQIIVKAKHLELPVTEADMISKLSHLFPRGIPVIDTGDFAKRKALEDFIILQTKLENIDNILETETLKNRTPKNTIKNETDSKRKRQMLTLRFKKPKVASVNFDELTIQKTRIS